MRLIPPQYVKPFVKRAKNDRADAEAICEAAGRPGISFVPVKSAAQQAQGVVLKVRETLVGQRTLLVNTLRGHAAEFGVIAAKGASQVAPLLTAIAEQSAIPPEAQAMLAFLGAWAGSAARATSACANCSCWAPPPSSKWLTSRATNWPRPG